MADPEYELIPSVSERIDIEDVSGTHPTNDDGEPLCTGKDDGQCNRTVSELGGVCFQHEGGDG